MPLVKISVGGESRPLDHARRARSRIYTEMPSERSTARRIEADSARSTRFNRTRRRGCQIADPFGSNRPRQPARPLESGRPGTRVEDACSRPHGSPKRPGLESRNAGARARSIASRFRVGIKTLAMCRMSSRNDIRLPRNDCRLGRVPAMPREGVSGYLRGAGG